MSDDTDFNSLFIDTETDPLWLDPPVKAKANGQHKHKRKRERELQLVAFPLAFLAAVYRSVEGKAAVTVALLIWRRTCVCDSQTVTLSGAELAAVGVSRQRKSKALAQLAAVGIIRIEKVGAGQTARVTLLWQAG